MLKRKNINSFADYGFKPSKLNQIAIMNNSAILIEENNHETGLEISKDDIRGVRNCVASNSEIEYNKNFRIKKRKAHRSLGPLLKPNNKTAPKVTALDSRLGNQTNNSSQSPNNRLFEDVEQDQLQDSDLFFENFEEKYVVKFPSTSKAQTQVHQDYCPSNVSRVLLFDGSGETSRVINNNLTNISFRRSLAAVDETLNHTVHCLESDFVPSQADQHALIEDASSNLDNIRSRGKYHLENHDNIVSRDLTKDVYTLNLKHPIVLPSLNNRSQRNNTSFPNIDSNGSLVINHNLETYYTVHEKGGFGNKPVLFATKRQHLAVVAANRVEKHLNKLEEYVSFIEEEQKAIFAQSNKENIESNAFPIGSLESRRPSNIEFRRYQRPNFGSFNNNISGKENLANGDSDSFGHEKYSGNSLRLNSRVRENQADFSRVFVFKKKRESSKESCDINLIRHHKKNNLHEPRHFNL